MPHQCTKCSKVYPDAAEELLQGCECGSRFFYYIRQEKYDELQKEVKQVLEELDKADKEQIEQDIRELTGLDEKPDEPVILDLESVRVIKPGKFEIDIVNLMNKNRPLIYKLEEGKYVIDLASSLSVDKDKVDRKIRNPFVGVGGSDSGREIGKSEEVEIEEGNELEKEDIIKNEEDKKELETEEDGGDGESTTPRSNDENISNSKPDEDSWSASESSQEAQEKEDTKENDEGGKSEEDDGEEGKDKVRELE